MKAPAKVWRLSLLAAVLMHLLLLAGWQMVRRRQAEHDSLRAADDTPMLLQFSREDPLIQEAGTIPLPPAAPLPPAPCCWLGHRRSPPAAPPTRH